MGKKSKPTTPAPARGSSAKLASSRPTHPVVARWSTARLVLRHGLIAVLLGGTLALAFWFARKDVALRLAFPHEPPDVVLLNRPPWMSDDTVAELLRALRPAGPSSAFDAEVLRQRVAILQASPWVRKVNAVRRVYRDGPGDTIEVDCEFRAPLALVKWQDYYWLVDADGYKLPEQYTAEQAPEMLLDAQRRTQMRIIEGVRQPPVESGQKWPGEDLAAALELARLLHGHRFADEIIKIDVSNVAGRVDPREAQIVLVTRHGSEIRWGRPVNAKDAFVEIPATRKLDALEQVYARYHRVDANQPWLDIRFDQVTYPREAASVDGSR